MKDWLRRRGLLVVLLVVLGVTLGFLHAQGNTAARTLNKLNAARTAQHISDFIAPANYSSMQPAAQVVAIINNERKARGLPQGLESNLDQSAVIQSLNQSVDPVPIVNVPGVVQTDTIWGWSSLSSVNNTAKMGVAIEYIDYSWVYNDAWNGSLALTTNSDCTSATSAGCNGHRDAILHPNPKGTTLVIIAAGSSNVIVNGVPGGTSAAAELVWTTDPSQFAAFTPSP